MVAIFDLTFDSPRNKEMEVNHRECRSHTAVGRWVTLSLPPSQQSYFLQGGPASLLGIPGTGLLL